MSRPALRITRHDPAGDDPSGATRFVFEVWNPWNAAYHPFASLEAALQEMDGLLVKIRQGWMDRDPALPKLVDVPEPTLPEETEWAEFSASAQANRVHETRNWDVRHWRKAMAGRAGALETTCNEVGYRATPA